MKKLIASIMAILFIFCLTGCTDNDGYPPELLPDESMPPMKQTEEYFCDFTAMLYFQSEDGRRFIGEERLVQKYGGESRAEAALRALMEGPRSLILMRSVPQLLTLERVEVSLDACNVYLTGRFPTNISTWLIARAAIAATVYAAEGIPSVNVYFNGVEPGYNDRALGAVSPVSEAIDVYLGNMEQEYEVLARETGEAGSYETRTATLYFADSTGGLLIARNAELNYARTATYSEIVRLLLSRLSEGDYSDLSLEPVLPADFQLAFDPEVRFVEFGSQPSSSTVINITMRRSAFEYDEDLLYAAVTLTLTGYIPDAKYVRIDTIEDDGSLTVGEMKNRNEYSDVIGRYVYLPYPDPEGAALYRTARAVDNSSANDPKARLSELFKGPADPGVTYPLFTANDIGDVYVVDGVCVIDWKQGFTDKLLSLAVYDDWQVPQDRRERMFIYGIINTITEIDGIDRVWMVENGQKLGQVDDLYLGGPLMRNPGILSDIHD